jgi:hypothetical protein
VCVCACACARVYDACAYNDASSSHEHFHKSKFSVTLLPLYKLSGMVVTETLTCENAHERVE